MNQGRAFPFKGSMPILYRDMTVFWRSKYSEIVTTAATPLTFFVIFALGLKGYIRNVEGVSYILFVTPGLISMATLEAAWEASAWSLWFHRKHQRTIDEYRVNPITVFDIVDGKILSGFIQGAFKGVVVAIILLPLTGFSFSALGVLFYLLFLLLGSMTFSCIGIICGTLVDKPETLARVYSVIIMPLIFLGGMFFPIQVYPEQVLFIVRLLPMTPVFDGARAALLIGKVELYYLFILFMYAAVSFALAVYIFIRKIEE
jgi:lipooligosaccharide transport system permease protein